MTYAIFISSALGAMGNTLNGFLLDFIVGITRTYFVAESKEDLHKDHNALKICIDRIEEADIVIFLAPNSVKTDHDKGSGIYTLIDAASHIKPGHLVMTYYI